MKSRGKFGEGQERLVGASGRGSNAACDSERSVLGTLSETFKIAHSAFKNIEQEFSTTTTNDKLAAQSRYVADRKRCPSGSHGTALHHQQWRGYCCACDDRVEEPPMLRHRRALSARDGSWRLI